MDSSFWGYEYSMDGIKANDELFSVSYDQSNNDNPFFNQNEMGIPQLPPNLGFSNLAITSSAMVKGNQLSDSDFREVMLKNISQLLMEEDIGESCIFQDSLALEAAEKCLYDVIEENYPPSFDGDPSAFGDQFLNNLDETDSEIRSDSDNVRVSGKGIIATTYGQNCELGDYGYSSAYRPKTSFCSSNSGGNSNFGFGDSPISTLRDPTILNEGDSGMPFRRGFQDAKMFLPNGNHLIVDLESDGSLLEVNNEEAESVILKVVESHASGYFNEKSKGKKNLHGDSLDLLEEERSSKQTAIYADSTVRSEMFDLVLLSNGDRSESALREVLHNEAIDNIKQTSKVKGSSGAKSRGKKKGGKKDFVDLRSLLTLCAQAVAANDQRTTYDLLKQIRQHSSPTGDGMQRIAHYFANGLEARLAGFGTKIYRTFLSCEVSAAEILKAYHLFLAVSPFKKLSVFFANKTILQVAKKATKLHIIDFGIHYGFQWPSLIQLLSSRPGGPPMLRITGVDFPQPGFRPADRTEETGRRLAYYAETFKVPFEFNIVVKKWETVQIEDIKINDGEVIAVNCMYRLRHLLDESVMVENPKDIVLNLIRKMKPNVFIHGVVNGAFGVPFFLTRFREALFHFSSLFDMLEANVPHKFQERMLLEKEVFGKEAINVIACEGGERVERPETYKQWQVRIMRAGFLQLPLNHEILKMAKHKVKTCYHKDFLIDEDGQWMLQGWKGRVMFAMATWKPAY